MKRCLLAVICLFPMLGLTLSTASGGEWQSRTFTPKMSSKVSGMQTCPEDAFLDVKWRINVPQPDDGTLDHVNPDRYYTVAVAGRETPGCFVSQTFGDHGKDWDYIVAWRDKVWADQGMGPETSLWDKAAAIANAASATFDNRVDRSVKKDDVKVAEHPVDGIIRGMWCVGESSLMIAAATTMGLEGRSLGMGDHTVCEIRIDGKWRYVENIDSARPHCLSTKSFIEFLENPDCDPEMPDRVKTFWRKRRDAGFVYGPGVGRYWQIKHQGGTYQVLLNPENAHALYPEMTRIPTVLPSSRNALNEIHWGLTGGVLKQSGVAPMKIGQDSGVRKEFYLNAVPAAVTTELFLDSTQTQQFPANGGDWVLQVNGDTYPLRNLEGFRIDGNTMILPVPVGSLRANAQNTIALRGTGAGDEYFVPQLYYDYLMPAPKFYYDVSTAR